MPLLLQVPAHFFGISTDPVWKISGVAQAETGIPGYPWIDLNVGFTSEALGRLAARDWVHGIVPWWNEFTGIGMPLAGELQPGAFFFPFVLLFLLPEGLLLQQICMQIIAGLATYALLRELGVSRLAALTGGALFSLNGTLAWAPGPAGVYCGLPFLPMQIWGLELARQKNRGSLSIVVLGTAIAWSILAGFPEPAYISGLLVLAWGMYRFATDANRWAMLRRASLGFALGLLLTAPLLISFWDYVGESDSFGIHKYGELSLQWPALSAMVMPYIYGLVQTMHGSRVLNDLWAEIGGYTSVPVILLATVGCRTWSSRRGLKILLVCWVVMSWAKTFGMQPVMGLLNYIPLLHQAAYYRYSPPSWIFALVVLAAFGLDDFRAFTPRRLASFTVVLSLVTIGTALAWPTRAHWQRAGITPALTFAFLGVAVAWTLTELLMALLAWTMLKGERRRLAFAGLLVADAALMFMVPQISGTHGARIDTDALQFLRDQQGLSRTYSIGSLAPNFGAYFGVHSIDHNVLPVPRLWVRYVDRHILPGFVARDTETVFTPAIDGSDNEELALEQHLPEYLDIGVRYVTLRHGGSLSPQGFLPFTEAPLAPELPLHLALLQRFALARNMLQWSQSVVADSNRSSLERSAARAVLQRLDPPAVISHESAAANEILLGAGQSATMTTALLPSGPADTPVIAIDVPVDRLDKASDGALVIKVCKGDICRTGQRSLAEVPEQIYFSIPLDEPLNLEAGGFLSITFTRQGGRHRIAILTGPATQPQSATSGQLVRGPVGPLPDRDLHLVFRYRTALPGVRMVYSDAVMDIWEFPNAAPYFQVMQGGPCALQVLTREEIVTDCAGPALLRRRELFMPGWSVAKNGGRAIAVQQDGIFESTALPTGRTDAHFRFVPPYETIGWAACALGFAGLLWETALAFKERPIVGI